jgi:hypothetical protein
VLVAFTSVTLDLIGGLPTAANALARGGWWGTVVDVVANGFTPFGDKDIGLSVVGLIAVTLRLS